MRHTYERRVFTVMMLLGELGGLYGAIVGISSCFISYFIQLQYMSAVTKFMSVKENYDSNSTRQLKNRLSASETPFALTSQDVKVLAEEASRINTMPSYSRIKRYFCFRHRSKSD